jgi:glycolate oxidase iron-sulfur subunit
MPSRPNPSSLGVWTAPDLPDYGQLVQCMRCGSCLPVCPTYQVTRLERDSPRGRIRLIKASADGELGVTPAFVETIDYCLDCRACEAACPSFVAYGGLVEAARAQIERRRGRPAWVRLARAVLLRWLFGSRDRMRLAAAAMGAAVRCGLDDLATSSGLVRLLPRRVRALHALRPRRVVAFPRDPLPTRTPARGPARRRVAVLAGCVMDFLYHDVNRDTIEVLARNGCDVLVPARQGCCGSALGHAGEIEAARRLARRILDAFDADQLDAIVVNAAGCGSFMRHYDRLLEDDPAWRDRARAFAAKVRDASEFLVEIGFERPAGAVAQRVTYHEACHLAHAQRVSEQPRALLRAIPWLELVELPEAAWCCGSAGIYNVARPDDARVFLERKVRNIATTGAEVVAVGNPGCALQIEAGLRAAGLRIRVAHPVSLLAEAYRRGDAKQDSAAKPNSCHEDTKARRRTKK